MTLLIDGRQATADGLMARLATRDGHATSFQAREGRVRGLSLHLDRLDRASHALFGADAPRERILDGVAAALAAAPVACTIRIEVFHGPDGGQHVLVESSDPAPRAWLPQKLLLARHDRYLPDVDHTALRAHDAIARRALRDGYDGVALVSGDGRVTETADACLGFVTRSAGAATPRIVWADGPAIAGIGRRQLDTELRRRGVGTVSMPVRESDLGLFDGAFVVCSRGVAPVAAIGEVSYDIGRVADGLGGIQAAFQAIPWESATTPAP